MFETFDVDLELCGRKFVTDWTANGSGVYTEAVVFRGFLATLDFIPDTTDVPTAGYDMQLLDEHGSDILVTPTGSKASLGTDLPASGVTYYPEANTGVGVIKYLNGSYTISIANAGSGKKGKIVWKTKNR